MRFGVLCGQMRSGRQNPEPCKKGRYPGVGTISLQAGRGLLSTTGKKYAMKDVPRIVISVHMKLSNHIKYKLVHRTITAEHGRRYARQG